MSGSAAQWHASHRLGVPLRFCDGVLRLNRAVAPRCDSRQRGAPFGDVGGYLSNQTSSMRQPLKMLLAIVVSPLTRGCQQVAAR